MKPSIVAHNDGIAIRKSWAIRTEYLLGRDRRDNFKVLGLKNLAKQALRGHSSSIYHAFARFRICTGALEN